MVQKFHPKFYDLLNPDGLHQFNGDDYNATEMAKLWDFHFIDFNGFSCFSFNKDGKLKQTRPNIYGSLRIVLKAPDDLKRSCFSESCGSYYVLIHSPKTLPVISHKSQFYVYKSTKLEYEYEERINMPKPYGKCSNLFPNEMKAAYHLENYNYSSQACVAFKYYNEIPFLEKSTFNISEKEKISMQCYPECFQHTYTVTDEDE